MIAIDCGYKDITKLLLEHKQLDVNERARNGYTPLSMHFKYFNSAPYLHWASLLHTLIALGKLE